MDVLELQEVIRISGAFAEPREKLGELWSQDVQVLNDKQVSAAPLQWPVHPSHPPKK